MENKTYKTTDLGEAATLLTLGFKLVRLENGEHPRQRVFCFNNKLRQILTLGEAVTPVEVRRAYISKKVSVDAFTYFSNSKQLKAMIRTDIQQSDLNS
jgi:hypothetical protein